MPLRIEDYALVGDLQTAALVGKDGSVDWLCFPRFDSGACFAALLGEPRHGRWLVAPAAPVRAVRRRYRPGTLVLETEMTTGDGVVRVVDVMPPRGRTPDLVRVVEGVRGRVPMRMELILRFDYGHVVPWVRRINGALRAVAGPDGIVLRAPVATHGRDLTTVADFDVAAGERVPFVLTWHPSHEPPPAPLDALAELDETERWWRAWSAQCTYDGPWRDAVLRSLITLKARTYEPTGGVVAAPTTSLPEWIGGVRNWDYRICWLRDATLTLDALLIGGFKEEAAAWRDGLLRMAIAREKLKATTTGLAATLALGALIVAGSRELAHFDAALVGYTFATLFATFAIAYRYAMWLQRPPTRMYWRRGWQVFFRLGFLRTNVRELLRRLALEFAANRFIWRRGALRWAAHWLIMWGCIIAALITFPLVFGWLHFATLPDDMGWYRIYVFGFPTIAFPHDGLFGFIVFHGLVWASFLVIPGVMLAFRRTTAPPRRSSSRRTSCRSSSSSRSA